MFFFFKQRTAYEMLISDWSSDVCSSDLTRANIEGFACRLRKLQRIGKGAGDIANMDKVAPLLAVLEDHRRLPVEQPGGEYGEDAGIGIGQRLPRPIDVEQPQADRKSVG